MMRAEYGDAGVWSATQAAALSATGSLPISPRNQNHAANQAFAGLCEAMRRELREILNNQEKLSRVLELRLLRQESLLESIAQTQAVERGECRSDPFQKETHIFGETSQSTTTPLTATFPESLLPEDMTFMSSENFGKSSAPDQEGGVGPLSLPVPVGPTGSLREESKDSDRVEYTPRRRLTQNAANMTMMRNIESNSAPEEQGWQYQSRCGRRFQAAVASTSFDFFVAMLILSNAAFIGIQVEHQAQHPNQKSSEFFAIQCTYMIVFVIEIVVRIAASGPRMYFCTRQHWAWNWFDCLVVLVSTLETSMQISADMSGRGISQLSVWRLGRIIRIVRIMRIIRVMRFFRHLRVLMMAIFSTVKSSFWTMLLLVMIIYTFAVMFTQSSVDHLYYSDGLDEEGKADLLHYFGSLPRAAGTLFMSLTGGLDWEAAVSALHTISGFLVFLFIVYISFVYFAVMNVVTGIFCQTAIESAQKDKDSLIALQLEATQQHILTLRSLFHDISGCEEGVIGLAEFKGHLDDKKVKAFFKTLEIDTNDALTLFQLLDADRGGTVDIHEFVEGCLRLSGNAKSIQAAKMMYENKWIMEKLSELATLIRDDQRSRTRVEPRLPDMSAAPPANRVAGVRSELIGKSKEQAIKDHVMRSVIPNPSSAASSGNPPAAFAVIAKKPTHPLDTTPLTSL
mmetsp:Transcript_13439/g.31595  ORF Transcript_13439/g.31595 Transcript_13439/m.31595 type:complete len:682 (-) Transcript_13439:168-2213(-)